MNQKLEKTLGAATDITNIEELIEDTQSFLLGHSWSKKGRDFFEELAEYLYKTLEVDYVCIEKLMDSGEEAHTIAVYFDGKFENNRSYTLADMPCGKVSGHQVCCFPSNVRYLFPKDEILQEMVAESYAGITLWNAEDKPIGLIAVIGRKPFRNIKFTELVLKQVSIRATSELEHRQTEDVIRESEERFLKAFNFSPMGINIFQLLDGKSVNANEAYLSLIGYSKEEVIGHSSVELNLLVDSEERDNWMAQLREGDTLENIEVVVHKKSGELLNVLMSLTVIEINGEAMGLIQAVDITERKKAEMALIESESRFKSVLDNSKDVIYRVNLQTGFYEYTSPSMERLLGYSIDDMNALNVKGTFELIHPDDLQLVELALENIEETGTDNIEYRLRTKIGDYRWISNTVSTIKDEKGKLLFRDGNIRDITDRKNAEDSLRESEALMNSIIDSVTESVWLLDKQGEVILANKMAFSRFNLSKEEAIGKKITEFISEDVAKIRLEKISEVFNTGNSLFFEDKRENIHFEHSFYPVINSFGKIKSVVSFSRDITNRKKREEALRESEQRLKFHFENSPLAVVEWDSNYNVTQWSMEAENIFGYKKEETIGKPIDTLNLIYEEDIPIVGSTMDRLTGGVEQTLVSSNRNVTKTGVIIETVWYNSVLLDNSGKMNSVVSLVQDITLQNRAENALVKLNEELDERIKERTAELQESNVTIKIAEEKYRTVADFTVDWEYWIDQNDVMLYCSPSCQRITGYSVSEFEQDTKLMYNIIHSEDIEIYLAHMNEKSNTYNIDNEIQFRIIRKDGTLIWIEHFCQPIYDNDRVFRGTRGSNKDITLRKKTEELLQASNKKYNLLSENISDGIFICKDGRFEYANKAVYSIFGYSKGELENFEMKKLVTPDYITEIDKLLKHKSKSNETRRVELECFRNDSTKIYVEMLFSYVPNNNEIYGVIHDITERRRLQKNILKAIIETEEKERSYFSKELHDGLGPLLSTIKLYLQWSIEQNNNESIEEIILKAEQVLEEALITVKEISNKLSPHLLTNYGLNSAIKNFVEKLNATSVIEIVYVSNFQDRLDFEIEAALYRATIECINNSLKHASASHISIILNEMKGILSLTYMDDGIGFDVPETLSNQKGLGLFNLQNRIQSIGGKFKINSKPGEGVKYQFTINV